MMEYWSNLKLVLISKVMVFIHCQFVVIASMPWSRKINRGSRLTKKDSWTAVFAWVRAQSFFKGVGLSVVKIGYSSSAKITIKLELKIIVVGCIVFTWSCTKSFWFLRPMDDYYPSKTRGSQGF